MNWPVFFALLVAASNADQGHQNPSESQIPVQPYVYAAGSPQYSHYPYRYSIAPYYLPFNYHSNYPVMASDSPYVVHPTTGTAPTRPSSVHHRPTKKPQQPGSSQHHVQTKPQFVHTFADFPTEYFQTPQHYQLPPQYPQFYYINSHPQAQQTASYSHSPIPNSHVYSIRQIVNRPATEKPKPAEATAKDPSITETVTEPPTTKSSLFVTDEQTATKPKTPKLTIPDPITFITETIKLPIPTLPKIPPISEIVKIPGVAISQAISQIGKITEGINLPQIPGIITESEVIDNPPTEHIVDISGGTDIPHASANLNRLSIPSQKPEVLSHHPTPKPVVVRPHPTPKPVIVRPHPTPTPVIVRPHPTPTPVIVRPHPTPAPVIVRPHPTPAPVIVRPHPTPKPEVVKPLPPLRPSLPRPHHQIPISEHHNLDESIESSTDASGWFPEVASTTENVIVPHIRTTFTCEDRAYGYYADIDNECTVYHVCHQVELPGGETQNQRITFRCGPGTVFSQLKRTCVHPGGQESCADAAIAYSINEDFGIVPEVFPPVNLEAQTNTFASLEPLNQRIKDGLKAPNGPFQQLVGLFPGLSNVQPQQPSVSVN